MSAKSPLILTINGGSSSIKFALFTASDSPQRVLSGEIERIGQPGTRLTANAPGNSTPQVRTFDAADHRQAAGKLVEFLRRRLGDSSIAGIGHRVVHGGQDLIDDQIIAPKLIAELRRVQPLDLAHLPREIALIEVFGESFPSLPQVACFDTAFHRDMPDVAKMLPIPRRYYEAGIRRFGFHGLSYKYLMQRLSAVAGAEAANGKIILAHLGSGASMAAVKGGKPIDTTMAFTPTAGLVMATRPGDLDPGLIAYLMQTEKMTAEQLDDFISKQCGMLGISQTSSDMRDLLKRRAADPRAADAVNLFCYQAKKFIGALAAAMDGLDTLVFAGGIGEHAAEARAGICDGMNHLGIRLDPARNAAGADLISDDDSRVVVRVMATDEEIIIAQAVYPFLRGLPTSVGMG
jgi:acetate kinase